MAFNFYLTQQLIVGDKTLGGQRTITEEGNVGFSDALTDAENPTIPFSFAFANLVTFFAVAEVDMTLNPDGMSNPDVVLVAGIPFVWSLDSGLPNPFVANMTQFVVTNVLAGQLNIQALVTI